MDRDAPEPDAAGHETTDAVVFADPSGRIRYWSPDAERLFGHAAAAAQGSSLDLIVPDEHRERHWAGFHRAMRTSSCGIDRLTRNIPVRCADGAVRVYPGRFTFVTDAAGRAAGAIVTYGEPVTDPPFSEVRPPETRS